MALSNKLGAMVLTTGNKSEMAVGYATLYGDMSGGYSVLKDVYKTDVFRLARWRNRTRPEGALGPKGHEIGRASCRERVCQYVEISVVAVSLKKKNSITNQNKKHR